MSVCCHSFTSDPEHAGYSVCARCGSYKSLDAPAPEELYTPDYWTEARSHSTFDDQVFNVDSHEENGKSKAQFILDLIRAPDRRRALEIACAPGIMLKRLKEAGFEYVAGIEVCPEWGADIHRIAGFDAELHFGIFPEVTKDKPGNRFSLILASDVFEHSHAPWPFLSECHRLLKTGGQLILVLPLVTGAYPVPERMFAPAEHVYIHSMDNLAAMLGAAGFHSIGFDKWCDGHEAVSAIKGAVPVHSLRAG